MPTFGATITAQAWGLLSASGALTPTTYTVLPAPVRNLVTGQTTAAGASYAVDMLLAGLSAHGNRWRADCGGGPARAGPGGEPARHAHHPRYGDRERGGVEHCRSR